MENKLWCDMENDEEKKRFFSSGRAHDTGIIAQAIENEIASRFDHRQFVPREEVLGIVASCFHAFASSFRNDAVEMATDIIDS